MEPEFGLSFHAAHRTYRLVVRIGRDDVYDYPRTFVGPERASRSQASEDEDLCREFYTFLRER